MATQYKSNEFEVMGNICIYFHYIEMTQTQGQLSSETKEISKAVILKLGSAVP